MFSFFFIGQLASLLCDYRAIVLNQLVEKNVISIKIILLYTLCLNGLYRKLIFMFYKLYIYY